jgi:hypothetical protein
MTNPHAEFAKELLTAAKELTDAQNRARNRPKGQHAMKKNYVYVVSEQVPAMHGGKTLSIRRAFVSEPNALLYAKNSREADDRAVFVVDRYDGRTGLFLNEVDERTPR